MCPVCTVTVVAGLGLSRLLGIDDVITSLWIGGLILSLSFITLDWLRKKFSILHSTFHILPTTVLMYTLTLIPLYSTGVIGIVRNTLWGIDKIILGITVGSIVFLFGAWADKKVRKVRGHQLFKYQKVIFPVFALILASVVFWVIVL